MNVQQDVLSAGDAGGQLDEGAQPVRARLRAVSPALKLARVHSKAPGQTVPCESADLLEPLKASGEVLRQKGRG